MLDTIFESWLETQERDAKALNKSSDVVEIQTVDAQRFLCRFRCKGLLRTRSGEIEETGEFFVGIAFADDYLRHFDPLQTISLLSPQGVFHPNVSPNGSGICPGHMHPGTSLADLVSQIHSILTYQHMNLNDSWNLDAAAWARNQLHRFPVDRRPLKRRKLNLHIEEVVSP